MIFRNVEIYNAAELYEGETANSVRWYRVPSAVRDKMESDAGRTMCRAATGVELRFVMESDAVTIRMRTTDKNDPFGIFHVYRGSIQGGWQDHEVDKIVGTEYHDYVIRKSENLKTLQKITDEFEYPFSPEVVRVIFDRGEFEILDIIGDVRPPKKEELPKKTLLTYGSSITHGSNAFYMSNALASVLAHGLRMDVRNLGMAGSCLMEPSVIDYIAAEGEKNRWDIAILELGINVLSWEEEKIISRVENAIREVAGRNPEKSVYVISPLYNKDDYEEKGQSEKWRRLIGEVVEKLAYKNVTYINGRTVVGDMSYISADEVHPNIYGSEHIAIVLLPIIQHT